MDIVVFDLETDSVKPEEARIIELGAVRLLMPYGEITDKYCHYVDSGEPISPEASAVNHITGKDIVGARNTEQAGEKFCNFSAGAIIAAHNARYDVKVIERVFLLDTWDNTNTLCTMRLAKHLLSDLDAYNLQYLRYYLEIDVEGTRSDRAMAHTALADATLTAKLFRYLWELWREKTNPMGTLDEFVQLCWSPIHIKKCPFRKHKGQLWEDVPSDYIRWCLNNISDLDDDLKATMQAVLEGRRT